MNKNLKLLVYGAGVFVVYFLLLFIIRTFFKGESPQEIILLGIFSKKDILMGLLITVVLTLNHYLKTRNHETKK